jgi:hypothetical protein
MASRDTRCPERSGLGPSLGRGQSRPGMSSIGCSTPDLEELRRLPRSEGNFRPVHGSRPARGFRGSGCSSGPQSCSWRHPPAEIVRARVASSLPRKRPGRGLVGVLHIDESTRQVRRPASRGNARRRALERAPRAVSHDRRHLDPGTPPSLTCPRQTEIRRQNGGRRLAVFHVQPLKKRCQRSRSTEPPESRKGAGAPCKARSAM